MKKIQTLTKCLFGIFLSGCLVFSGCDTSADDSDSGGSGNSTGGAAPVQQKL